MSDQRQNDRIDALEKGQEEILALLRPIADTYSTASTLGKWAMALLVFISITLGVILSIKSIFK
jgi:hypothetical protein